MLKRLKSIYDGWRNPDGYYANVKLSPADIEQEAYKKFLGGGEEKWESRGRFQLHFLKMMGLEPAHRLLDIGCGPIRAGEHLIAYLDPSRYCGVDYNPDFIQTARELVAKNPALVGKQPVLLQLDDFDFAKVGGAFDYAMTFSVLNHCDARKRKLYFENLPGALTRTAKVYITHAFWFKESMLATGRLKLARKFTAPTDISPDLNMGEWGWPPDESIYPILELMPA